MKTQKVQSSPQVWEEAGPEETNRVREAILPFQQTKFSVVSESQPKPEVDKYSRSIASVMLKEKNMKAVVM